MSQLSRRVALLVGLLLVGSSAAARLHRDAISFSHAEHAARDPGTSCVDCHDASLDVRRRTSLKGSRCAQCHDDVPRFVRRARVGGVDVPFPHATHARAITDCKSCHQATDTKSKRDGEWTLPHGLTPCFTCHEGERAGPPETSCASCHGRDERRARPGTHTPLWLRSHGPSALLDGQLTHGQSCKSCHQESGCRSCHQVTPPQDHTALWRMRTHGSAAAWDRTRCQTCHQTGQCVSCHNVTPPMNHRGAWVATHGLVARDRADPSCLTCHQQSSCIRCHQSGIP